MKKSFLIAPIVWLALLAILLVTWLALEPVTLIRWFDQSGYSPVELATLPFFAAIVPMVWWKCPFEGSSRRRMVLCLMVSIVAVMAIVKETDLHLWVLHRLYPNYVDADGGLLPGLFKPNGDELAGTPFKMRALTNGGVPLSMKFCIGFYFMSFFGTFVLGFAYLLKNWVIGVFKLVPSAWAVGCFGASGVMVQLADRLPSWLDHRFGLYKTETCVTYAQSLCTALEEGGELMMAIFALLAVYLGHKERK